jgi:two-component system sensor histidine kinase UhpB
VPDSSGLVWAYVAPLLAVAVILSALGAALVIYQRRFLAIHREYAKKLIAAHEEERAYVAREVHDDALQRVAMLQHELRDWADGKRLNTSTEHARASALAQELEDLGVMLRRVAHRLHPAIIEQGGLIPALAQLADDVTRASSVDVHATLPPPGFEKTLSRDRAIIVFRIAQEALRNVVKHSEARKAEISVEVTGETLALSVKDDGKGFDSTDPARKSGIGLISISERARLVDGKFSISSSPGQGTTVRVHVPLKGT